MNGGDCYMAAAKYVLEHPEMTLVHGEPFLQRPPYERFGHAWAETPELVVHDVSNGKHIELPVLAYYALGNIVASECRRYTAEQIRERILATEHWGPWPEEKAMSDSREEKEREQVQCAECGAMVEQLEVCPGCGEMMCSFCVDYCDCDEE